MGAPEMKKPEIEKLRTAIAALDDAAERSEPLFGNSVGGGPWKR